MARRLVSTVGLGILVAFRVATAGAAEARQTWWVDARPEGCSARSVALTGEIRTACEATGQCAIATSESAATRRATLVCKSDDAWSLEARSSDGRFLWALPLEGEVPDRLRQGGVWAARSEVSAPPPPPVEVSVPAHTGDGGPQPPPARPESRFGIAGGVHGDALSMVGDSVLWAFGVRGNAAIRLAGATHVGGSLTWERATDTPFLYPFVMLRAAALVGWGAPWNGDSWGLSLGAGRAFMDTVAMVGPATRLYYVPSDDESFFGEATGHAKLGEAGAFSLFASLNATAHFTHSLHTPNATVALGLGTAWRD
jgi:hypothetical protein